jgi:hypothetical protein
MLRTLFKVETETVPAFGDAIAKADAYISGKGTSAIKNLLIISLFTKVYYLTVQ